jgi:hypothetical protein
MAPRSIGYTRVLPSVTWAVAPLGVMAMALGRVIPVIGIPAVLVALSIGVTVLPFVTLAVQVGT